ncbi:MAG: hypothetical protein QXE80_05745 [Pyrobaculum sp.]
MPNFSLHAASLGVDISQNNTLKKTASYLSAGDTPYTPLKNVKEVFTISQL